MSTSTPSSAPEISPPASTSFPADMVGRRVKLFLLYREGEISGVHREDDQERTLIKFVADGLISSGKNWRMKTARGLKFDGDVNVDETSTQGSILVMDNVVDACHCCRELAVPAPPFSLSMVGMKFRFSEPDPYTIEASVLEIEKHSTLSVVDLEMTSVPPYAAHMGDRLMLRSGLSAWEVNVVYFGAKRNTSEDEGSGMNLENKIRIHVRDDHVPQGPKTLPYTKIYVRPAQGRPAHMNIGHEGRESSQMKRRLSAREENEGYRDMGRALARVALDSEDVDLVAISDPSITDQVSCMFNVFKDSKCDFEVKSVSPGILLFGQKEIDFFRESDSGAVPWHMACTKLVVTTTNCSGQEEDDNNESACKYSQFSDARVAGRLETILGSHNSSTTLSNSWAPILTIRPINERDAKAVDDCFPLWKGRRIVSVVRFQGTNVIFQLEEYPNYVLLSNNTQPSINVERLVRWCFHMLSRIPNAVCDVEMSERPRRGCR